jgi:hypothetical protein
MIPQKFSEWCVDDSGYHPTTQEGQKRLSMQVEKEIKQNLFSNQTWESKLRELEVASDRLEETIDRMMRLEDLFIDRASLSIPQGREEDDPIWNGVDSRFGHS